jgi:hypothetical protein
MIGDMRRHIGQPGFGIDPIQSGSSDQHIHSSSTLTTLVDTGKEEIGAARRDATQFPFSGRVVDFDAAIVCIAVQCQP